MFQVEGLSYGYETKNGINMILDAIDVVFEKGKLYAILGKSGSGKSTLLSLMGALDEPKDGKILLDGIDIRKLGYSQYRSSKVAMVFQEYNLLSYYSAFENVKEILRIQGRDKKAADIQVYETLETVGITGDAQRRLVSELSGGERQRVAIARALVSESEIILADEPTGNLDFETAKVIVELLYDIAHNKGKYVIMVTHDDRMAEYADVRMRIKDQKLEKYTDQLQ